MHISKTNVRPQLRHANCSCPQKTLSVRLSGCRISYYHKATDIRFFRISLNDQTTKSDGSTCGMIYIYLGTLSSSSFQLATPLQPPNCKHTAFDIADPKILQRSSSFSNLAVSQCRTTHNALVNRHCGRRCLLPRSWGHDRVSPRSPYHKLPYLERGRVRCKRHSWSLDYHQIANQCLPTDIQCA